MRRNILFLCQHFGTGVLMATAFVHLLPTAFTSLTDPCLPHAFNKGYRPLAGLIAMISALAVVAFESYLTTRGAGHSHSHHLFDDDGDESDGDPHIHREEERHMPREAHRSSDIGLDDLESTQGLVAGASPLPGSTPTIAPVGGMRMGNSRRMSDEDDRDSLDFALAVDPRGANGDLSQSQPLTGAPALKMGHDHNTIPPNTEEQKRLFLQCALLECGILFHSVFIGMALSVATGSTFVVFLIAIGFHQSFEGLALGTRIAALHFPRASPKPWLMVLAFGLTTPIGQAIGLIVHRYYDPMSQTGLLMVGVMNAISSGLLLFAGLVQLLAEDFLTEKSYKTLHGRRRVNAFLAVVGGALSMSAVGAVA